MKPKATDLCANLMCIIERQLFYALPILYAAGQTYAWEYGKPEQKECYNLRGIPALWENGEVLIHDRWWRDLRDYLLSSQCDIYRICKAADEAVEKAVSITKSKSAKK